MRTVLVHFGQHFKVRLLPLSQWEEVLKWKQESENPAGPSTRPRFPLNRPLFDAQHLSCASSCPNTFLQACLMLHLKCFSNGLFVFSPRNQWKTFWEIMLQDLHEIFFVQPIFTFIKDISSKVHLRAFTPLHSLDLCLFILWLQLSLCLNGYTWNNNYVEVVVAVFSFKLRWWLCGRSFLSPPALQSRSGRSIINGNWAIDRPGKYEGGGTMFTYSRPNEIRSTAGESFLAEGPTNEILDVYVSHKSTPTSRCRQ